MVPVSIIIPNWNGQAYLAQCLPSVFAQTYTAIEVIVVDNGSVDGSVAWLKSNYPNIHCIANSQNQGFASASNQGALEAKGEYIALLNNDTWLEPDWLSELVQALETDSRVGMAASLMVFATHPTIVNSAGICIDQLGIVWDRLGGYSITQVAPDLQEVFGPCGGAALYRRTLWEELGGFDENFFAYLEDVDLAWRARWRGWRAIFNPKAKVYHVHSGTSKEGSEFKTYWLARNKIQLLLKNYPLPDLAWWGLGILLYDWFSLLNAITHGKGRSAWAGRWAGWCQALRAYRLRPTNCAIGNDEMFSLLESWVWPWQAAQRYAHHTKLHQRKGGL